MDKSVYKGQLKRWNEDKGFGFIEPEKGKGDIFIHISALKRMNRRPAVGDLIHYQLDTDNDGKSRAVYARIEGVAESQPRAECYHHTRQSSNTLVSKVISIALLIFIAAYSYHKYSDKIKVPVGFPVLGSIVSKSTQQNNWDNYRCEGKVHCSEMSSCEEAMFYLNNCPGTKMDGDRDGVPCESQWCGR